MFSRFSVGSEGSTEPKVARIEIAVYAAEMPLAI